MRYTLQVLMPWDDEWYTLTHVPRRFFLRTARHDMADQRFNYPVDYRLRIVNSKGEEVDHA